MKNPITIVIPAYNRAHTLPRTLRSIETQTVAPDSVVLVDNGSSDDSLRIMHDWASRQTAFDVHVVSEKKRGACAARNRGLEEVTTEFVMFFDSDDEMLPCHIEDFTRAIRQSPDNDIFGRSIITENLEGKRRRLYFTDRAPMFNHLFRGCLSTQRVVVRTDLVRKVGGWNEMLPVWDDYELGVRLLLATNKIKQLPGSPSVITYLQTESITGTSFSAKAGQWERILDEIELILKSAGRNDLLKWVDCRRMILAAQYRHEGSDRFADELFNIVCSKGESKRRLQLVYYHNLKFHRLTWLFARLLFIF